MNRQKKNYAKTKVKQWEKEEDPIQMQLNF